MKCLSKPKQAGFSLVEVTLSVAIAALAIITLLGLLPQGLEMSRKTGLLTSNSYVLDQIIRDLENAKWSSLTGITIKQDPAAPTKKTFTKYYNDEGVEVSSDSKQIVLVAAVEYVAASLPQSAISQYYMVTVKVRMANTSNKDFDFNNAKPFTFTTFNHMVAKTR